MNHLASLWSIRSFNRTIRGHFASLLFLAGLPGWLSASSVASVAPSPGLLLPATVWAAPDCEFNLYFENAIFSPIPHQFLFDVTASEGAQFAARWSFRPKPEHAGSLPWALEIRDLHDRVVATGNTTVRIARAEAGAGREIRLLAIGDSLTQASVYTEELLRLFTGKANPRLILLGTHQTANAIPGNVHEGYNGWTWKHFHSFYEPDSDSPRRRTSPFVYQDSGKAPTFDFARYIREQCQGVPPDFITLFLGPNDVSRLTDETRETGVREILAIADQVLQGIRAAAPRAAIGLVMPLPPGSQDGFGTRHASGLTRWTMRKNIRHYTREFMNAYRGQEANGLYLVPAYLGFDAEYGYPSVTVPVNARSSISVTRQRDNVHPNPEGYRQVADVIYAWIKNLL